MKKQPAITTLPLFFFFLPMFTIVMMVNAQERITTDTFTSIGSGMMYTESIPVIDIHEVGRETTVSSTAFTAQESAYTAAVEQGGGSDPTNPYAVIRKSGSAYAAPETAVRYAITLANYDSITRTYQLTDTLPTTLTIVEGSAQDADLTYDSATRTLTWQGEIPPAHLDYLIEESDIPLPYLDLAAYGAPNLCDPFFANAEPCKDAAVTFNLGINGYTAVLYGETVSQLTVSSNGLLLGGDTTADGHNQWLPDTAAPNFLLAGLWRDVDMGSVDASNGRFHAAIITGLIDGQDVFYAQWHDAPTVSDLNITARHAIAVVLDTSTSSPQATTSPLTGHVFYIYDNISDPAQTAATGYTIGIEDKQGVRGVTYAYAPCCGDLHPPQGYPPTAGTTLHLHPTLFGADNGYSRTFSYEAVVNATVPQTIANTAFATSDSDDPAHAFVWSTHYLHVRWQTYLPLLINGEG